VEEAEQVSREAFYAAEETQRKTQQELNELLMSFQEVKAKLAASEVRERNLQRELDNSTSQLRTTKAMQSELESLLSQRDFEVQVQINRKKEMEKDLDARELQIAARDQEIERLGGEISGSLDKLKERDEDMTKLELELHTQKMRFLALKREVDTKTETLDSHALTIKERDKQMERYRDEIQRREEVIAKLKTTPDESIAKQVVQSSMLTSLEAKANALQKQLIEAEEDIFISSLKSAEEETSPLVEELHYTRQELTVVSDQLQLTEKESVMKLQNCRTLLEKAQRDLGHMTAITFQHQSYMMKVEELQEENEGLRRQVEAMDVAYEGLLSDIAVLSSSPFGQKMIHRDWDWKKAAQAFRLVTTYGAKATMDRVHSNQVISALSREVQKTLRATILSVMSIRLDHGATEAFKILGHGKAVKTLFWGAGPGIDPMRSDLMFWFLLQPWGTESAAHAHHLGAYVDGNWYRLVVLKALITEPDAEDHQSERVTFDPFTVIPIAVITYQTNLPLKLSYSSTSHPLSYLRYTESYDEDIAASTIEKISQKMGAHGVALTFAMATLQTPYLRQIAQELWTKWKPQALQNVINLGQDQKARRKEEERIIEKKQQKAQHYLKRLRRQFAATLPQGVMQHSSATPLHQRSELVSAARVAAQHHILAS